MRRAWIAAAALGVACGGPTPPSGGPPPPAPSDAAVAEVADPMPAPDPPPAAPETFTLARGASHTTAGGLTVTYAGHHHKHAARGGAAHQTIALAFARGGATGEASLGGADPVIAGEVDALGTVLQVSGNFDGITVTALPGAAGAPLTMDEARALVDAEVAARGLTSDAGGARIDNGVYRYDAEQGGWPAWSARVGVYSRQVTIVEAPAPAYVIPTDRPAPEGPAVTIPQGESATLDNGLKVTYAKHGHKHYADRKGTRQDVTLEVRRGNRKVELRVAGDEPVVEAELVAHGALLVVAGRYADVTVTLAARKAPKPLAEEAAVALITEAAARHGLPGDVTGWSDDGGILRARASVDGETVWLARVGLYTKRVWFERPPPPARRR